MRQNSPILLRRSFLALLSALLVVPLFPAGAQGLVTFKKSQLSIKTAKGRFNFNIELAVSSQQQSQGLMYRRSLAADAGMLFDYRIPQRISMWMKNTFIPLDMIFIGQDGTVINIAERTIPQSEVVISSKSRARAVLEVNGGTASRLGIMPGDQVLHSIFK
tara:strand:- start:2087 stop:2569 length:483 start_codon:yes stop_codon:yes gene_type:complete